MYSNNFTVSKIIHNCMASIPTYSPFKVMVNFKCFKMIGSLMKLMVDLGMAYKALSRYELCQCLEFFSSLPPHQMNTPWVFTQLARAHFEQGNYNEV